MPASPKLRRALALTLAGGSLAIGVPAALAATGGGDAAPASSSGASDPAFIQDAPNGHGGRADREDCPEHGGGGQNGSGQGGSSEGGSGGTGGSGASGTTTPAPAL